jgi:hypothetical protein
MLPLPPQRSIILSVGGAGGRRRVAKIVRSSNSTTQTVRELGW